LVVNQKYYFTATAYDTNGIESDFSNEASFVPETNVVTFVVNVLSSPSAGGPFTNYRTLTAFSVTNPVDIKLIRTLTSVTITNIAH
jgi:hypothetical protein